jgi:hypothetical protein
MVVNMNKGLTSTELAEFNRMKKCANSEQLIALRYSIVEEILNRE